MSLPNDLDVFPVCTLGSFTRYINNDLLKNIKFSYRLAIRLGGDTDTIASMAGAISGAYLGIEVC